MFSSRIVFLMNEWPTCERTGMPPALRDRFGHAAAADQVVEDLRAGIEAQRVDADERGHDVAADQRAVLVDDEHAVGVAVERDAEIAAVLDDGALQVDHVLGFDRARGMVRERAVEFEVERDDFARQVLEDARHRFAGHAVAGVDRDLERFDRGDVVDEREAVLRRNRRARRGCWIVPVRVAGLKSPAIALSRIAARPVSIEIAIASSRQNLNPLYCAGIVRGRDHDAAVEAVVADGEVDRVGRDQADLRHVGAGIGRRRARAPP